MPDAQSAIGVFDSGLGGLTAVRALQKILPHEDIIYFGDTGRVPYGTRSTQTIIRYAKQDLAFLLSQNVKFILAACGTVSSTLPESVIQALPVGFAGVIACTAKAAVRATQNQRIGIIGTTATIASNSYTKAIHALLPCANITSLACPLFVPLVENGYTRRDHAVTRLVAEEYLLPFQQAKVDTLILGCTHYPLLSPVLQDILGPQVTLIDAGYEAAVHTKELLHQAQLLRTQQQASYHFFVSDNTAHFASLAQPFLGTNVHHIVKQIDIEQYNTNTF